MPLARGTRYAALLGGGGGFSPLSLSPFIWLDPSDLSTLFQDAAMTIPVVADSDPVGAMLDKSGNGHHLTQVTAGYRPLYKTSGGLHWLEFDGGDQNLSVDHVDLPHPVEQLSAVNILVKSNAGVIIGASDGTTRNHWNADDTLQLLAGATLGGLASPGASVDFVLTTRFNSTSSRMAVDNGSYVTGNAGSTAIASYCIAGVGNNNNLSIRYYTGVQFDRLLTDPEIASLRAYLAAKQGRVL